MFYSINKLVFLILFLILSKINCNILGSEEPSQTPTNVPDKQLKIDLVSYSFKNCELKIYVFSKIYGNDAIQVNYNGQVFKNDRVAYLNREKVKKEMGGDVSKYLDSTTEQEFLKILYIEPVNITQVSNVSVQYQNRSNSLEDSQIKLLELKSTICNSTIKERILELNGVFFYSNSQLPVINIEAVRKDQLYHRCIPMVASNSSIRCILDKSFFSGCIERIKMKNVEGFSQQYTALKDDVCSEKPLVKKLFIQQDAVSRSFKLTIIGKNFEGGVNAYLRLECEKPIDIYDRTDLSVPDLHNYGSLFLSESSKISDHILIYNFPDDVSDVLELNDFSGENFYNYLVLEQLYGQTEHSKNITKRELVEIKWSDVVVNNTDSRLIGLVAIPGFLFMVFIILIVILLYNKITRGE
ncbi:expressed protein [Dictyostelium purpureum]|uniref:Expressed protein n=1 Tax=Dictyostelium purpureum TaxID=5786 RepID=F0ZDM2_DICPU|nr:uncharacterized protein DICPUDRAFT_93957 [Dictyostelium purpureum]EGC37938.1 expressed protein [Dictyostelium purpureum]|eukprot:XP_003285509.1 expressed protein [Dictyostelium purpureum]